MPAAEIMLREGPVYDNYFLRVIGGGECSALTNRDVHSLEELGGDGVVAEFYMHLLVVVREAEGTPERVVIGERNEASGGDGFNAWKSGEFTYDLMDVGGLLFEIRI